MLCLSPGSPGGWYTDRQRPAADICRVLVRYKDDKTLVFQKSGTGSVEDLKPHLNEAEVQFALLRIQASSADPKVTRDVFVAWFGPKVKTIEKGKKKGHIPDVRKVMQVRNPPVFVRCASNCLPSLRSQSSMLAMSPILHWSKRWRSLRQAPRLATLNSAAPLWAIVSYQVGTVRPVLCCTVCTA
jgi:hypothetical protein